MANTRESLLRLESDLMLQPASDAVLFAAKERLAKNTSAVEDHLTVYISLVHHSAPGVPEADVALPHLLAVVQDAPYLQSANSRGIVKLDTAGQQALRDAWSAALLRYGSDPDVLRRAADFYADWDQQRALALVRESIRLQPDHPVGRSHAGALLLEGADRGLDGCTYGEAVEQFTLAVLPGLGIHLCRGHASTAAFEDGDYEHARAYACEAIAAPAFGTDDQAHFGWTTLGRLALRQGDIAAATSHIQSSVVHRISYAGPSVRLAVALAREGYVDTAVDFIGRIAASWNGPRERCAVWLEALRAGNITAVANPGR
jgi:hypothetical protein